MENVIAILLFIGAGAMIWLVIEFFRLDHESRNPYNLEARIQDLEEQIDRLMEVAVEQERQIQKYEERIRRSRGK